MGFTADKRGVRVNKLALRMSGARGIFVHFNSLENLYILLTGGAASYLPTVP